MTDSAVSPRHEQPAASPSARILVAVPVYNEAEYLPVVLPKIIGRAGDVLVINDGSTDTTAEALARYAGVAVITHPSNLGYGQSLIDAYNYADKHGYDWVVTMDCDAQHDPRALSRFFERCQQGDADIVSGSRYLTLDQENDPPPEDRFAINRMITTLVNGSLGLQLTDTFCGYKAHRVSRMLELGLDEVGYAFPMQLWPRAVAAGLKITEVPVRRIYKDASRHFGGQLDIPDTRLRHYLEVFSRELRELGYPRTDRATRRIDRVDAALHEPAPAANVARPCTAKRSAGKAACSSRAC